MLQADPTEIASLLSLKAFEQFYHLAAKTQKTAVAVLLFFLFSCFSLSFS